MDYHAAKAWLQIDEQKSLLFAGIWPKIYPELVNPEYAVVVEPCVNEILCVDLKRYTIGK